MMYPSREEAMSYRRALGKAVEAARKGERLERDALGWPAGLDRTLLQGLPLPTHTQNTLLRSGLTAGNNQLTVGEVLETPEVGPSTVQNMLIGVDVFLEEYIETFERRPGPADVAAMRLAKEVQRLTPMEAAVVDERMLKHPPTEFHTLAMRFDISSTRIQSRLVEARGKFEIALGAELSHIAVELKADLGPSPRESDVNERIDALLDEAAPNDEGSVESRTRKIFRHALIETLLNLEPSARTG